MDKYPPEKLSLLPTVLRRQLLLHLPAVDLHRLENTSVTVGFDMTLYWKALLDHVNQVMYPSDGGHGLCWATSDGPFVEGKCFEKDSCIANSKENFLDGVALHIAIPQKVSPKDYYAYMRKVSKKSKYSYPHAKLFCLPYQFPSAHDSHIASLYMKATLQRSGLNYFCSSDGLIVPSRLESAFITIPWDDESTTSILSLMRILVDVFDYRAPLLPFDSSHDELYSDGSNAALVEQFLSQVRTIEAVVPHNKRVPEVTQLPKLLNDVLKTNLLSRTSKVRKLKMSSHFPPHPFRTHIEILAPYLSQQFVASSDLTPYRGLQEIEIYNVMDEKAFMTSTRAYPLYKLAAIIENQEQLQKVRLQGMFPATPGCKALMVALAGLVSKRSLKELRVIGTGKGSEVNVDLLAQLLVSYLYSPTSHAQQLVLYGLRFTTRSKHGRHGPLVHQPRCAIEGQDKKSLILDSLELSPLAPVLQQIPPVSLESLDLSTINSSETRSNLPNITASAVIIDFESRCNLEVGATVSALILNSHIKKLRVSSHYEFIPNSYLSSLGVVIAEHAKLFQTLKSITFRNSKAKHPKQLCDDTFYSSLIDLAQVVPLELKLQNMEHYLRILHQVWKEKNPAQKFCKLVVFEYPDFANDMPLLQEMAEAIQGVTDYL